MDDEKFEEAEYEIGNAANSVIYRVTEEQADKLQHFLSVKAEEARTTWRAKVRGRLTPEDARAFYREHGEQLWMYKAIHKKVLIATFIGTGGFDFATYVMPVEGQNHEQEVRNYPGSYSKLRYEEACGLVPQHVRSLEEKGFVWRR